MENNTICWPSTLCVDWNIINSLERAIKNQEASKAATIGVIAPADSNIVTLPRYLTLLVGSNRVQIDKNLLLNGKSVNPMIVAFPSDFPLSMKLSDDGKLLVDCNFRDLSGKIVAEMINNEWEINPNNYFQRNYDAYGVEVIDQEGISILQIDFVNNNTIKLGGVIRDSQSVYFISDTNMNAWDIRLINKTEIINISKSIPKMFVYPAVNNLGKRAKR